MPESLYRGHKVIFVGGWWRYDDTLEPLEQAGPKGRDRTPFRFADQPRKSLDKPES